MLDEALCHDLRDDLVVDTLAAPVTSAGEHPCRRRKYGLTTDDQFQDLAFMVDSAPEIADRFLAAKANSGRSSLSANQIGVLRGFVSAYSQNDVAGTTQRLPLPSQRRQCGPRVRQAYAAHPRI